MSLSAVHGSLVSLKTCQSDIGTAMDLVTDVAMDLAETQGNTAIFTLLCRCHVQRTSVFLMRSINRVHVWDFIRSAVRVR